MHGNIRNLNEPANFQVFKCELPREAVNADTKVYVAFCGVSNSNMRETNYN
jgi:hypothetical protein